MCEPTAIYLDGMHHAPHFTVPQGERSCRSSNTWL